MTEAMELRHAIDRLESAVTASARTQSELSDSVKELRTEIASIYVRKDVLNPTLEAIKGEVQSHGEWITWATRIVLALVIAAVVGVVLTQGGTP